MSISILTVARLGATPLGGLLEHLADLETSFDFEVVIAANEPEADVRALLATLVGDVTIVDVEEAACGAANQVVLTPSMRPSADDLERLGRGELVSVRRAAVGPLASVIVCTRDRPAELAGCVESLLDRGLARSGCEVVIVDNGASDGAADAIAMLAARAPDAVRGVREPVAGLARARMAGAAAARHDVLIYLDDDARPDEGWLESLRDAFCDPSVAIAGGPIRAVWDVEPEGDRVPAAWGFLLGVLDLGDADRNIAPEQGPFGGNWAVRRRVLDAVGGFDLAFGPSDRSRLGGEESHVGIEVVRRHLGLIRYVAEASVGHRTSSSVTDEQLVLRAFRVGAGEIAVGARAGTIAAAQARARLRAAIDGVAALLDPVPASVDRCLAAIAASEAALGDRLLGAARVGQVAGCAAILSRWSVAVGRATLTIEPENARGIVGRSGKAVSSW